MKFIYTTDRLYLRTLDERSADKILEFYNAGKDVFSRVRKAILFLYAFLSGNLGKHGI